MNWFKICIFGLSLISSTGFAGIRDVGNGGDVVLCSGTYSDKYYSLDYVLTYNNPKNEKIVAAQDIRGSLNRIEALIQKKVPKLYASFADFALHLFNSDSKFDHIWTKTYYQLPEIDDEDIFHIPRAFCGPSSSSRFEIQQAVVRTTQTIKNKLQITYNYDAEIFSKLNHLQLSFLVVHEWLWSLSSDVNDIRQINRFLHSNAFENLNSTEVTSRLKQMGLFKKP